MKYKAKEYYGVVQQVALPGEKERCFLPWLGCTQCLYLPGLWPTLANQYDQTGMHGGSLGLT